MRREYNIVELKQCKYPNLIAEVMETGYSICTLSEHMGHGRCSENNPLINEKLYGQTEIDLQEAVTLMGLFRCDAEYLFSKELNVFGDKPIAYYRHYESNKKQAEDSRINSISMDIHTGLKEKPYLADFMKSILSWTEEQVEQITTMLYEQKIA